MVQLFSRQSEYNEQAEGYRIELSGIMQAAGRATSPKTPFQIFTSIFHNRKNLITELEMKTFDYELNIDNELIIDH